MERLLHSEILARIPITGRSIANNLLQRVTEVDEATHGLSPIDVSVVVRSRNNQQQLEGLFADLEAQNFSGEAEVVVVDTESTDGSTDCARRFGATVLNITQAEFNYPKALNLGFRAASFPWILSLVDHSLLTNTSVLQTATRWHHANNVAAAFGTTLPNYSGTLTERLSSATYHANYFRQSARPAKPSLGFLAANCALIQREAWQEAGGFDVAYEAGGEDSALGSRLLAAGHEVMHEPALSVFHSHGVGPIGAIRQGLYWLSLSKPQEFDRSRLERFRSDLT